MRSQQDSPACISQEILDLKSSDKMPYILDASIVDTLHIIESASRIIESSVQVILWKFRFTIQLILQKNKQAYFAISGENAHRLKNVISLSF